MSLLSVDHRRLWARLMDMAQIGATEHGGCNRQAFTEEDKQGRELLIEWANACGCSHRFDEIGNLFIRYAGEEDSLAPVVLGSHLDTQPTGGKFDGILGVLAGFEVIERLHELGKRAKHPIEVVAWSNEEGCRFDAAMMGSAVWSGVMPLEEAYALTAKDSGNTALEELERIGQKGTHPAKPFPIKAAIELHIEQGPVLEAYEEEIGVVTGVQNMSRHYITIVGQEAHAGPTPMHLRNDPIQTFIKVADKLYQMCAGFGEDARLTIGVIEAQPASPNTVPGKVIHSIDIRHPDNGVYQQMLTAFFDIIEAAGSDVSVESVWEAPGVTFDAECVDTIEAKTKAFGYSYRRMVSGAGHDSVNVSKVAPTAMIFIPCRDGLSHNEAEYTSPEQVEKGANVLINTVWELAN